MPDLELYNGEANIDPPARFATDEEIELADRLRRQLEERYLASAPPSAMQPKSRAGD